MRDAERREVDDDDDVRDRGGANAAAPDVNRENAASFIFAFAAY